MKSMESPVALGVLAGALLMLAADAAHWFITPHPEASGIRTALVAVQLIAGLALSVWAWRKGKELERKRLPGIEGTSA
jgi:hypothetical protein